MSGFDIWERWKQEDAHAEPERVKQQRVARREEGPCVCKPKNKRHTEGFHCITKEQLEAWRKSGEMDASIIAHLHIQSQNRLAWLWLHFSQDPEARRLSGRVVTLAEADRLNAVMDLKAWANERSR